MDFLSYIFASLAISILVCGIPMNYCSNIFPEVAVRLFKYGRANISKSRMDFWSHLEVPKRWFGHFYFYAVVFQASILYSVVQKYVYQNPSGSWLQSILSYIGDNGRPPTGNPTTTLLVTVLFLMHLSRRLLETWFVSIYSGTKMNVLHYGLAFIHYTGTCLSLIASSPGFCSNDYTGYNVSVLEITFLQLIGVLIFFYGNYQQYLAHQAYADLRKGKDKTVTTYEHKIPTGGLFDKISCPNYWAEILIYCAVDLIFEFRNHVWNFCTLWVIANQTMSGVMNHKWYQEKFRESYPKTRKAVIPYLW